MSASSRSRRRRIFFLQPQPAVRHEAEAAPFEAFAQLEKLRHLGLGALVAAGPHRAAILVFHFMAAVVDLPEQHQHAEQHVERFKSRDRHRLGELFGEKCIRVGADHGRDVRRTDKTVDAHAASSRTSGLSGIFWIADGVST